MPVLVSSRVSLNHGPESISQFSGNNNCKFYKEDCATFILILLASSEPSKVRSIVKLSNEVIFCCSQTKLHSFIFDSENEIKNCDLLLSYNNKNIVFFYY